ncbi:hypothetical protein BJ508DRAFT_414572 [Ascobolus immersus RN42]|uniref:RRM domain-containing protein n=1 Tax=Ascobolus immersus RN42 TaxID=1160509 RepID=A0A3N4ICI3_ASCIM|nr:hypothetical protein BJ508DRAFT_414572 [Ascobolus immersus RN42]
MNVFSDTESNQHSRSRVSSEEHSIWPARQDTPEDHQFRSSKIIIEKLTKNVTVAHLKEVFEPFGEIQFVDLPENGQFDTNKGVAYILYNSTESAEAAVAYMDEAQIDGSIIQVSLVYPKPIHDMEDTGALNDDRGELSKEGKFHITITT